MLIRNINKNISFGTYYNTVYAGKTDNVLYRNDTMLFRSDINWNTLTEHITQDNSPKKIYCYACSDGSEPYSLAIMMINKLGYNNAKQYFPIIAKDIDENVISMAKNDDILLERADLHKLSRYQPQTGLQYITPFKNMGRGVHKCKVNKLLSDCILFEKGDLLKDIDSLNMNNSVLMFRNAWPYLPFLAEFDLMKILSKKFTHSSSLIIGDYDRHTLCCNSLRINMLKDYGFEEVKPLIFQKKKIL